MAYHIKFDRDENTLEQIDRLLRQKVNISRFTCDVSLVRDGRWYFVEIRNVRLRVSKHYCGNHAGPCRLGGGSHRKAKYLEGADWVAFNDMVNDTLDEIGVSATVQSAICVCRQGRERCVEYMDGDKGDGEWAKYGEYENHCGKPHPKAEYPNGTPGIDDWRADTPEASVQAA